MGQACCTSKGGKEDDTGKIDETAGCCAGSSDFTWEGYCKQWAALGQVREDPLPLIISFNL